MQFSEEFLAKLQEEITKNMNDDGILEDDKKLAKLANLVSIYQSINTIKMTEMQTQFMKQSAEQMKNVDFSKFDIKGMLGQLVGK